MKDGKHIDEDAWINPAFEKHMVNILMPSFGRIIRHLDIPEEVVNHMKRLGQFHKKRVKITQRHVEVWLLPFSLILMLLFPCNYGGGTKGSKGVGLDYSLTKKGSEALLK